jgi:DNA (cytosine-5)-methyltransferase 1
VNVLSCFSGIGGLDLGLDRAGMNVIGQVEKEPWRREVLAMHWPEVPRHDLIETAADWWLSEPRPAAHVVAAGFPCQPFSVMGRHRGAKDERAGLWWHLSGVVSAVRPGFVILENVPGLVSSGAIWDIHDDLASLGYRIEATCLPASAVGAPHLRKRIFIVAYRPEGLGHARPDGDATGAAGSVDAERPLVLVPARASRLLEHRGEWPDDAGMDRVADGPAFRLDRYRREALGDAVVPAVGELIGRLVLLAAEMTAEEARWLRSCLPPVQPSSTARA